MRPEKQTTPVCSSETGADRQRATARPQLRLRLRLRPRLLQQQPRTRRRERGFALVAALAVLVLLASIGSMMLRLTGIQQAGSSTAILGSRAHFAARAGIEWGLRQGIAAGTCPAASTPLSLSEGAVSGFTVVVTCSATTHVEGSRTRTHLALRARAEFASVGSRDHVVREVGASIVL